jgi:hypothetical protein
MLFRAGLFGSLERCSSRALPAAYMTAGHKLVLSTAAIVASGCNPCGPDHVIGAVASPNGKFLAAAVNRDCGATTGFRTILSITTQKPIVADAVTIAEVPQQSEVRIQWVDINHLRFICQGCEPVNAVKTALDGSELYVSVGREGSLEQRAR